MALTKELSKALNQALLDICPENLRAEVKKAATDTINARACRTMGGRSAAASMFKKINQKYSAEVSAYAHEVIDWADDILELP